MKRSNWVLLLEREKGTVDNLKALLLRLDFQVLTCADSARAQWYLRNQNFACVVINHEVSAPNALAVKSSVKKSAAHPNNKTPFIMMSEALNHQAGSQFIEKVKSVVQTK